MDHKAGFGAEVRRVSKRNWSWFDSKCIKKEECSKGVFYGFGIYTYLKSLI